MLKVQILGAFVLAFLALALGGCGAPAPMAERSGAQPSAAAVQALPEGRLCRIDGAASSVRIHVFRAGAAARLGHNHVLAVPALSGWVAMPAGRFELSFRLDEMVLDLPAQRSALGPGWASAVSEEAVAATRKNMLGEAVLDAARFPTVRIRSLAVAGEAPRMAVQAEFELHGQRHAQWLPMQLHEEASGLIASGALVLRQSDFGIKPFSVLGGLLAVRDELVVDFELRCRF